MEVITTAGVHRRIEVVVLTGRGLQGLEFGSIGFEGFINRKGQRIVAIDVTRLIQTIQLFVDGGLDVQCLPPRE